jgi:hypothetical protein
MSRGFRLKPFESLKRPPRLADIHLYPASRRARSDYRSTKWRWGFYFGHTLALTFPDAINLGACS